MTQPRRTAGSRPLRWGYAILLFIMTFTGFGQMPIFDRYYLSDIPGLGWSSDFYLTHTIHYVGAILLIALILYVVTDFLLAAGARPRLTRSAYARIFLLTGLVLTGVFRVLKNLPDWVFSPGFTVFIDISHLGFMMVYLGAALGFAITKSGWVRAEP